MQDVLECVRMQKGDKYFNSSIASLYSLIKLLFHLIIDSYLYHTMNLVGQRFLCSLYSVHMQQHGRELYVVTCVSAVLGS